MLRFPSNHKLYIFKPYPYFHEVRVPAILKVRKFGEAMIDSVSVNGRTNVGKF